MAHAGVRRAATKPASGAWRRSARSRRPSRTWSRPQAYPAMYPPEDPDYHPMAVVADAVHGRGGPRRGAGDRRAARGVRRGDARRPAAGARWRDGAGPADATAFAHRRPADHGQRRRVLRRPRRRGRARGVGRRPSRTPCARATAARTSTSSATRARRASTRRTRARRGTASPRIKRRYDPDNLFRLQPEHPARRRGTMTDKLVAAKLLIRAGDLVWLSDPDRASLLGVLPDGAAVVGGARPGPDARVAVVIAPDEATVRAAVAATVQSLRVVPILWVLYPKGGRADINRDTLRPSSRSRASARSPRSPSTRRGRPSGSDRSGRTSHRSPGTPDRLPLGGQPAVANAEVQEVHGTPTVRAAASPVPTTLVVTLVPAAAALDIVGGYLDGLLGLATFMDMIGTCVADRRSVRGGGRSPGSSRTSAAPRSMARATSVAVWTSPARSSGATACR